MTAYTLDALRKLPTDAPVREVAAALDLDVPGWEHTIDLEKLDMERGCCCVAGQIAHSWRGTGNGYMRFSNRLPQPLRAFGANQRLRVYWVSVIRRRLSA